MSAPSDLFSTFGAPAKVKLVVLGSMDALDVSIMDRLRSLTIEHVSPSRLLGKEISRSNPLPEADGSPRRQKVLADGVMLPAFRRWFWTRKPDAGFIVTDFPATLLQAKVFDEWLESRDESLSAVFAGFDATASVVEHYRTLGLLIESPETSRL